MEITRSTVFFVSILFASSAFSQSAFEGVYGQVSTGYEKNTVESVELIGTDNGSSPNTSTSASPSSSAAPLVLGLGYTFKLQDQFTLDFGIDYSSLTQTTNSKGFSYPSVTDSGTYDYEFSISNRFNIFLAPGYAIDDNKVTYFKLGYSHQEVQYSQTNCCSVPSNDAGVDGYILGLGYRQTIAKGLYGFIESNYQAYSSANMSSTYTDGPGGSVSANPDLNAYNVLVGLGYTF
jgi:hypothetical protein